MRSPVILPHGDAFAAEREFIIAGSALVYGKSEIMLLSRSINHSCILDKVVGIASDSSGDEFAAGRNGLRNYYSPEVHAFLYRDDARRRYRALSRGYSSRKVNRGSAYSVLDQNILFKGCPFAAFKAFSLAEGNSHACKSVGKVEPYDFVCGRLVLRLGPEEVALFIP